MNKSILAAAGILMALLYIQGLRLDIAKRQVSEKDRLALAHWAAAENLKSVLAVERELADRSAALAKSHSDEVNRAITEINDLRNRVSSGSAELRINATCPDTAPVPETASSAGRADAASPRLAPDAERAYWRLREQHERVMRQVLALQEYARMCSAGPG